METSQHCIIRQSCQGWRGSKRPACQRMDPARSVSRPVAATAMQMERLEVFLEEGESRSTWGANEIRVLDALPRELLADDGRAAKEHTDVFALMLLAILLEDAAPVGPPEELPGCTGELLHLGELNLTCDEQGDIHDAHRWPLRCSREEVAKPVELLLATTDPVEVDLLRHHHKIFHQLLQACLRVVRPGHGGPPCGGLGRGRVEDRLPLLGPQLHGPEDGGEGRHANAGAHNHQHVEAPDLLGRGTERSSDLQHHGLVRKHPRSRAAYQGLS
mmetsp:Transcript_6093/g.14061  ORF Transcript_6093/g.14061 Transcript_6093/m.14061 type:complete len:273 (+) Transcript_6093:275-1093(+)